MMKSSHQQIQNNFNKTEEKKKKKNHNRINLPAIIERNQDLFNCFAFQKLQQTNLLKNKISMVDSTE